MPLGLGAIRGSTRRAPCIVSSSAVAQPLPHVPSCIAASWTVPQSIEAAPGLEAYRLQGITGGITYTKAVDLGELGMRNDLREHYAQGKRIGEGSFGVVYQGSSLDAGDEVAIKEVAKFGGKLPRDKSIMKIFRETNMLRSVQGVPGVVKVEACYEDNDNVYIVTELCQGGDLHRFVEVNGPMTERQLAHTARQVVATLVGMHRAGVFHGDVKPGNFCLKAPVGSLDPPYELRTVDFGCAQALHTPEARLSKRTGTPCFMAPEMFSRDYGLKADMWSLGVMLYWLLSERYPFFTDEELQEAQLWEIADEVTNGHISFDDEAWDRVSPACVDFISSCLTRDEAERFSAQQAAKHPWLREWVV